MKRALPPAILAFVLAAAGTGAETAGSAGRVEWAQGRIVLERDVAEPAFDDPQARFEAERRAGESLGGLFLTLAPSMPVDSWDTLGTLAVERPSLLKALGDFALRGTLFESRMSEDLRIVRLAWSYPLFGERGLVRLLVIHQRPFPLPRSLSGGPTAPYTGLIIYAAEPVPAHGESQQRLPRPSLFPRIYDEEMNLVLEKEMCDPESLVRWGMVAYTDDASDRGPAKRIGENPLRTMARGVFGRNGTDLLIPRQTAHLLLANETNRALLREGHIMIVYSTVVSQLTPSP